LKKIFYADGQTTVCLLKVDNEIVSRGISICSRRDDWDGAEGRKYALGRAREAYGRQTNCGRIILEKETDGWCDVISLSLAKDRFGDFKGYYFPYLTSTEEIIVNNKKWK